MARLDLVAPSSWNVLTQEQLIFLLKSIVEVNRLNNSRKFYSADDFAAQSAAQVAVLCLFRWNNIKLISPYGKNHCIIKKDKREFIVDAALIADAADKMNWIARMPESPVRIDSVDGAVAVEADLDDSFSFDHWLACEALWQAYQAAVNNNASYEFQINSLTLMAEFLYHKPGIKIRDFEALSIFYWWAAIKEYCNHLYPNFFQPAAPDAPLLTDRDMIRRNMDAQIRALTRGDITKEKFVLDMPAHRALTELDALAREFDDINRKYGEK